VAIQQAPAVLQSPADGESLRTPEVASRSQLTALLRVAQELTEPKTDADSNTAKPSWAPAQVSSSADKDLRCACQAAYIAMDVGMDGRRLTHFHRSIERKMQHFVYLVVRRNGVWQFLEAAHSSGETIRQVRI
jgi:hypothetical protein